MVAEKTVVNDLPPLWVWSPKKFINAHKGGVRYSLWQLEKAGTELSLNQFVAHYIGGLPENLPPDVLLEVTKLALEGWQVWYSAKKEAVLA